MPPAYLFFFFNDTATTEIYTLSLHDALPICAGRQRQASGRAGLPHEAAPARGPEGDLHVQIDRKSTRLNSSHGYISYAVFCLQKQNKRAPPTSIRISPWPSISSPDPQHAKHA